jgi:hypothetical protein
MIRIAVQLILSGKSTAYPFEGRAAVTYPFEGRVGMS